MTYIYRWLVAPARRHAWRQWRGIPARVNCGRAGRQPDAPLASACDADNRNARTPAEADRPARRDGTSRSGRLTTRFTVARWKRWPQPRADSLSLPDICSKRSSVRMAIWIRCLDYGLWGREGNGGTARPSVTPPLAFPQPSPGRRHLFLLSVAMDPWRGKCPFCGLTVNPSGDRAPA